MVEIKHSGKSMDQRVADRLKNSGDVAHADHHNVHGTGPTRAHTNIHHSRVTSYGEDNPGEPGIDEKFEDQPADRGRLSDEHSNPI